MRRLPFSRRIWFGPIGLDDIGDLPDGNPADRRFNQKIAQALGRAAVIAQTNHEIEPFVAIHHAGNDASIGEPLQLLRDRGRLQAIKRRTARIDNDFKMGNANLLFDLQVNDAGTPAIRSRNCSARERSVSRSSP